MKYIKNYILPILMWCIVAVTSQVHAQCIEEGYKTDATIGVGSNTILSPNYTSEIIVGQTFISESFYSYSGINKYSAAAGNWAFMYMPPIIANVEASDGTHEDRIEISWTININTPAVTGGFKIYRDGFVIGTVSSTTFSFIDYNVIPGVYYTYGISGINGKGEGYKEEDLGYVNPNGVISGRITTFSGSSVKDAIVSLLPSKNLSLRFNTTGGLFVDTLESNPNPLVDDLFTLTLWAKTESFVSEGLLFDYGKADDVNFWMGVEADSSFYVAMADVSGTKKVSYKDNTLNSHNLWHHLAAVYNGRDLMLFYDGSLVNATAVSSANTKYANHRIGIGAPFSSYNYQNRYNGYIDEVRLFNRAQRPAEIKKFMNYTVPTNYDGLVAYWKMNEGKGDKVINQVEPTRVSTICNSIFSNVEPGIKIAGISDASGYYLIEGVNYASGTSFQVIPSKYVPYNTALEFNDIESNYAVTSEFLINDSATIELWVSPYHYNGIQYILSSNGTTPFDLFLDGNTLKLNIDGQTQSVGTMSGIGYKYISILRERGDVTVAINNQNVQTFTYSNQIDIAKSTWHLGNSSAGGSFYAGLIDGLVVWNRALIPTEIQLHNNVGVHSITKIQDGLEVIDADIEAFIHLNDQEGTQIVNEIPKDGSLQFGTIYGAQFVEDVAHELGIDHQFNPNSRIVTLNNSNTSADGIDFTDITTVPVTGIVKYANSNCYIKYAEILLDGKSTSPPTYTKSDGSWTLEMEPGADAQLSAKYLTHDFEPFPFFQLYNVVTPKAGIAFLDQDKRTISGVVAGGTCNLPIIEPGKSVKVSLQAINGCYADEIILDENSDIAFQFDSVPPGEYNIVVTHSDGLFTGSIGEYFDILGGKTIDVTNSNATDVNFIYRSVHNIELSELISKTCGSNTVTNIYQGTPQSVSIKVYEEYLGEKCYLDTALIVVNDYIGKSVDPNFNGTKQMTTGEFIYSFYAGEANILAPYTKGISIIARVDSLPAEAGFDVVVLGNKKRSTTFTTTTPELPMSVLRDPPGDQSYALMESTEETCMTNIDFKYSGLSVGTSVEVNAGADITTFVGLGAGTQFNVNVTAMAGISASVGSSGSVTKEFTNCVTFSEILETSTMSDIIGQDADIYLGAALNIEYGLTDLLSYIDSTCSYRLSTELTIDPKEFNTFYAYTEYHLINDVIPSNYLVGDTISAKQWESFIALNQQTKDQATFKENRSFDAGAVYSSSSTTSKTKVLTTDFSIDIDGSIYGETGVEVNGIGVTLAQNIDLSLSYGGSNSSGTTETKTIAYTLSDDDLGDNFTVNIYEDKMFGTPVFKLVSGESSCPWEENTLPREGVQVLVDNLKQSTKVNVSTDESALFTLYLGNTSQSEETMTYAVDVVNSSNPDGAILSINGNVLGATSGGNGLTYTIEPFNSQFVTLALDRGADPNIFEYDSIQVVFQSICDDQISDTVMVSAHFVEPCSSVDISAPQNNWILTPANNGTMAIVMNGYDETDPDLELIRVQYRKVGSPSWINIKEVLTADLGATTTQVNWTIGSLTDGDYELRALSQCTGGLPTGYSAVIPGIIEQSPPKILGTPQPADGVLNSGDEISVTFTEDINCDIIYQADQNGLNNIGLYNLTTNELINATIQCVGNKITITPLIPSIYMENNTLEVRITEIEDLVGNVLEPDNTGSMVHKWDFYVNVSPVGWVGSEVEETMIKGTNHTFTRVIENTGGNGVIYTILTPSYIAASSTTGTLPAGGQKTITFTVNPQLTVGEYVGDLVLKSSYGEEDLPFNLRVMCESPSWYVNPSAYNSNMNFTVAVDIEGIQSSDEYDIIAGFVDGQLRGKANVQYIASIDKYLAFLSVYGNAIDNGKEVTFKVWDASECKLYDQTYESYPFAVNGQVGTPLLEDTIHTKDLLAQSIHLNQGWNWISFNLDIDNDTVTNVMNTLVNPNNGIIKSQTKFSQYYPSADSWVGGLSNVNEYEMYQIKVDANDSLEFFGRPINVDSTKIPLVAGWNWISYLPQGGMSPDWAFQVLNPYNGDLVKNQYFFAQFVAGYGWIGNLTFMDAPSGYLYKSSIIDTLRYPVDANSVVFKMESENGFEKQKRLKDDVFSVFEKANVSPNQFRANMNVIGVGISNDAIITEQGDKVYAYINGEIRGVAESMKAITGDSDMFFLTIYGNTEDLDENVEFKYFDASSSKLYNVEESVSFQENDVIGLVQSQFSLTIGAEEATSIDEVNALTSNVLSIYPNPINEYTVISIYAEMGQNAQINVYDNIGKLVGGKNYSLNEGISKINFKDLVSLSKQTSGIYHISVVMDNQVYNAKLINK